MKKTLLNTVMVLGLVAGVTACSDNGDDTPPVPAEIGSDNLGTCTGTQVFADHERVQIKVNCQDIDGLDLYGETGHPVPYIDVQGFQQALSSIPEEHITRNADGVVIAVVDWQVMGYFQSSYSTTGKVVMWSVNGESGEYEQIQSQPFTVQTAQAPTPVPEPEPNTPPIANNLTVNAAGAGSVSGNIIISDAEDAVAALTVDVKTAPLHGVVAWTSKTGFTYTVTAGSGYNGDDSFSYQVTDSKGLKSAIKTVTVLDVIDL